MPRFYSTVLISISILSEYAHQISDDTGWILAIHGQVETIQLDEFLPWIHDRRGKFLAFRKFEACDLTDMYGQRADFTRSLMYLRYSVGPWDSVLTQVDPRRPKWRLNRCLFNACTFLQDRANFVLAPEMTGGRAF